MQFPYVNILGIHVHEVRVTDIHNLIKCAIEKDAKLNILNVNIHAINLAFKNEDMKYVLNSADLVFCDGAGVMLGARILNHAIPERITYADWMWQLAEFAARHGFSIYLLGGKSGIAEKAAKQLTLRFPDLLIAGTHHGYFEKQSGSKDNAQILSVINQSNPQILLVAFGMPLQEQWLRQNRHLINANIALTGGAVLDYVSGELQRAPDWLTNNGLEWLGRLIIEPKRLWRRYVIGNPLFISRVIIQKLGILRV